MYLIIQKINEKKNLLNNISSYTKDLWDQKHKIVEQ